MTSLAIILAALLVSAMPALAQQPQSDPRAFYAAAIRSGDPALIAMAMRMMEIQAGIATPRPAPTTQTCYRNQDGRSFTCYAW